MHQVVSGFESIAVIGRTGLAAQSRQDEVDLVRQPARRLKALRLVPLQPHDFGGGKGSADTVADPMAESGSALSEFSCLLVGAHVVMHEGGPDGSAVIIEANQRP